MFFPQRRSAQSNSKIFITPNGTNFVLAGIDGQTNDANTVINGINQLLSIVNFQNEYDPEDALRTVIQSVNQE